MSGLMPRIVDLQKKLKVYIAIEPGSMEEEKSPFNRNIAKKELEMKYGDNFEITSNYLDANLVYFSYGEGENNEV